MLRIAIASRNPVSFLHLSQRRDRVEKPGFFSSPLTETRSCPSNRVSSQRQKRSFLFYSDLQFFYL
ncbi:MAG: hypothetical protein ACRCT1_23630 [Microcoleaceae cyanobacterium]